MTDISVWTQQFEVEDRSWDLTPVDGGFVIQGTIDVASWDATQHYANGFIPSGAVVAKDTSSGKWVPYLDASATAGHSTAVGILKSSVRIKRLDGTIPTAVAAAALVHGVIDTTKLPYNSTNQALGGYIDADAETDLKLIYVAG